MRDYPKKLPQSSMNLSDFNEFYNKRKETHGKNLTWLKRKWDNLVLSTGLIMWIGHRKEIQRLTFRALALRRSESFASLRRRATARNVSFRISLRWPIHIINPVDKTKLSCYTPHRRSTTVSLETYPLWKGNVHDCKF